MDSLYLFPWVPKPMLCQQVAGPFLILHYFPLLRFPLQKPLANFLILRGSRGLTFDLSFSKTSRFHIFKPTFWLLSLLSFFANGLIPFYQAERSPATFLHGPSSQVPRGTKLLFMSCWFPSLLILFCIIGWLMGHICPHSSCFWACLLELSQSQLSLAAHPEDSRLLGIPRYPGSIFFLGSSVIFLPLKARLDFFFPLFCEVQSLPIHGLRSLPIGF